MRLSARRLQTNGEWIDHLLHQFVPDAEVQFRQAALRVLALRYSDGEPAAGLQAAKNAKCGDELESILREKRLQVGKEHFGSYEL